MASIGTAAIAGRPEPPAASREGAKDNQITSPGATAMAVEEIGRLRSIAIVGQGATGKTELAEAMMFTAGTLTRQGRPDDGTAAMDFEPEEIHRKISISSAFHHYNWRKDEVIVADTPGYQAFLPDAFATMRAVDGLVFVATAGGDLKVESEKIWAEMNQLGLPRIAFVSRLDRERASFDHAMADLEKALIYAEASGKPREEALNAEQKERAETARTRLCEAVAETDDALLEKYLDKGVLEEDELRAALRAATIAGKLTPVLCGSGLKNIGIGPLLDAIDTLLPAPNERPARQGFAGARSEPIERAPDPAAPFSAFVFKTVLDPFAGKLSIFRVVSGHALSDAAVMNSTHGSRER